MIPKHNKHNTHNTHNTHTHTHTHTHTIQPATSTTPKLQAAAKIHTQGMGKQTTMSHKKHARILIYVIAITTE